MTVQVLNWLAAKQEKEAEAEKDQAGSSDKPPAKRKRGWEEFDIQAFNVCKAF